MTFGTENLEWLGYPIVKKKFEDKFIRFHMIHERDGHTYTQTDNQRDIARRHRPRLCIASRGKNLAGAIVSGTLCCGPGLGAPFYKNCPVLFKTGSIW